MSSPLLINEPPLQVLPSLAVVVGLNEAIVLQQIHYWMQRSDTRINGHVWVYNSVTQWKQQFPFWSDDTIARALKSLRKSGALVAEQLSKDPRDRSLFYRIDYRKIHAPVQECITATCGNGRPQDAVIPNKKTETTTESRCCIPCDHVPIRSWPLFKARELMRGVIESFRQEHPA